MGRCTRAAKSRIVGATEMRRWIIAIALTGGLCGCATNYGSGPTAFGGGLRENQLEPDRWRIVSDGNGYTTRLTIRTYWVYRAAELTLEKSYDGFEIQWSDNLLTMAPSSRPIQLAANSTVPMIIVVPSGPSTYTPFRVEGYIHMLKTPFTPIGGKVFDAAATKALLEPLVKGEKCDKGNVCPHNTAYLRPALPLPRSE